METLFKLAGGKKNKIKNTEVNELKQQLEDAQTEIVIKDKTLNEIAKQNEILYRELKQQQGLVRSLKQQLEDERWFHQKQNSYQQAKLNELRAKYLSNEVLTEGAMIAKAEKMSKAELCSALIHSQRRQTTFLQRIKKMEASATKSTEIIYNLGIKFLRMKYLRDVLQKELTEEAKKRHIEVENSKKLLADIKEELERTVQQCYNNSSPPSSTNAVYLQMVRKNGRLMYENALLQHEVRRHQNTIRKSSIMHSRHINICMDELAKHSDFQEDEESSTDRSSSSSGIPARENKNEMNKMYLHKSPGPLELPNEAPLSLRTHSTPTLNLMQ